MNNTDLEKYKKEMRTYAQAYSMLFRASTREDFIKENALAEKTIKGKWVSAKTSAITVHIKRKNGTELRVLVVTKKNHVNTNCTGLLWLHGGGYAIGTPEMDVPFANLFLEEDNCVMVLPDYTHSVDAPYPAALEDAYQTLLWMKENAASLGIREDQLFVGGESAGGGLACALTLYARDHHEVNIAFQMPLYPMLDDRMTETSSHNTSPIWDTKKNLAAWALYRGDTKETSPYFAPARETDFHSLPPAFTIITENEPFYAEVTKYFVNLYRAGNEVMIKEYPGCFHSFDISCPNTVTAKQARKLEQNVFQYAQSHYFAKQESNEEPASMDDDEIDAVVADIESQHAFMDAAQTAEVVPEVDSVKDEMQEAAPSDPAEENHLSASEEDVTEETVPEPEPVVEETTAAFSAEPQEEPEASAEEIEAASKESTEESAEPVKEETVEERPVSEGTTIDFPQKPQEKEMISDNEIDQIAQQVTAAVEAEEVPPAFEETVEAEEEPDIIVETVKEEEKPEKETFTREDVMRLLHQKEAGRRTSESRPYPEESPEENVMNNVQKLIEDDTCSSLEEINHLVDGL